MNIKLTILTITLLITQHIFSQCESITIQNTTSYTPFKVDKLVELDGLRNGPDYAGAELFFPVNANKNLKSIILVPGYRSSQKSVTAWAKYLAARGFLSITIGTNTLYDNPNLRAAALIDGMETIRKENKRKSSPLYGKIDTKNIAVGGWSMGGGGAQLAAKMDSRIKVVLAFAPWLGKDTSLPLDLKHASPVLIISGQNDPTAPPALHSDLHYQNTPNSTNKLLIEISEGNHRTPLNPEASNGDVGNIAFAWLQLFLEDNNCYCSILREDSLNQNSNILKYITNINCITLNKKQLKDSN